MDAIEALRLPTSVTKINRSLFVPGVSHPSPATTVEVHLGAIFQ